MRNIAHDPDDGAGRRVGRSEHDLLAEGILAGNSSRASLSFTTATLGAACAVGLSQQAAAPQAESQRVCEVAGRHHETIGGGRRLGVRDAAGREVEAVAIDAPSEGQRGDAAAAR